MSLLVKHEWDRFGAPPPIGQPYHVEPADEEDAAPYVAAATRAAELLRMASEKREEAEEYERDAEPLLEGLPKLLRDAIEDDPWAIDNAVDVAKAMGKAA